MKTRSSSRKRGFTLLETVIAIGVLAVLLTGFMVVFAPAAAGIRKSINVQEADRLASTLEQELVTFRTGQNVSGNSKTGFAKAFDWIKSSSSANNALLVYQYRGSVTNLRPDGTPSPEVNVTNKLPGKDYIIQSIVRQKGESNFTADLPAVEGGVYVVKCTQLVFSGAELKPGDPGSIKDPKGANAAVASEDLYPEAVIAFSAEFFNLPTKSPSYFGSGGKFDTQFTKLKSPVFTRNLAVRR